MPDPNDPLGLFGGGRSATPTAPNNGDIRQDPDTGLYQQWNGYNWTVLSAPLQKLLGGGGSVSQTAANYHLDPRELQLEYDKLRNSLTETQLNDLKDLIENRNTESVGLANAYTSAAEKAAAFQQHPENAIADVAYRNAVFGSGQGATPYGSTSNQSFQDRQQAMQDTFQQMFGPAADALRRAGEFIGQIPPSEYLSPPSATAGAGGAGGGGGGGAGNPPTPVDITPNPNATNPETGPTPYSGMPGGGPTHLQKGGTVGIVPDLGKLTRFGGYQPSSSEGGTNMNIHEKAVLIGLESGHHYLTVGEGGYPEQVKVIPTPAGKKAAQEAEKAGKTMSGMMSGAKPMAAGGTLGVDPLGDPSVFLDTIRKALSLRGIYTGANQALPDPRLLAGDEGQQLMQDPTMGGYITSAYSSLLGGGIKPAELDYTINRFRPAGIRPSLPKVTF